MDKKVKDLLNEQIMKEFYSAYLYLDMANYYGDEGLEGRCQDLGEEPKGGDTGEHLRI